MRRYRRTIASPFASPHGDLKVSELPYRPAVEGTDEFLSVAGGMNFRSPAASIVGLADQVKEVTETSYTLLEEDNRKLLYFTSQLPTGVIVTDELSDSFSCRMVSGGGQLSVIPIGVSVDSANGKLSSPKRYTLWTLVGVGNGRLLLLGDTVAKDVQSDDNPPENTSLPTITASGSRLVGDVGNWTGNPSEFFFSWQRGTANIEGAEGQDYNFRDEDIGSLITFTVVARNEFGDGSATSAAYGPITGVAPVNTVAPTIVGGSATPKVGEILTIAVGSWTGIPTPVLSYQWKSAGVDVPDATQIAYGLTANDLADLITAAVKGSNSVGEVTTLTAARGPVAAGTDTTGPTLSSFSVTPNGETAAFLSVSTNEGNGIFYWTIQNNGIAAPSAAQIKAGLTGAGGAATSSGNIDTTSVDTWGTNPTGLSAGTVYNAYGVMYDAAGNASNVVTSNFTTAGSAIPILSAQSCPDNADIFAWMQVTTNNGNGTLYVVVVPANDPAPSVAQIKLGQNSAGVAAPKANVVLTTPGIKQLLVRGLTAGTSYRGYFVQNVTAGDSNVVNAPFISDVLIVARVTDGTTTGLTAGGSTTYGVNYTASVPDPYGGANAVNMHDIGDNSATNKLCQTSIVVNPFFAGANKIHINIRWVSGGEWTRMQVANVDGGTIENFNVRNGQIAGATGWSAVRAKGYPLTGGWMMFAGANNCPGPDLNGIISLSMANVSNSGYLTIRDGTNSWDIHDWRVTRAV